MTTSTIWIALLSGMNLLWACSYVAVKIGLGELDPATLIFWRFGAALIVLIAIIAIRRPSLRLNSSDIARIVGAGALLGASNWLWVAGINLSHATDASLLYVFEPIWGILLASIILRERILWTTITGLGFVLAGLAALSNYNLRAFGLGDGGVGLGNVLIVLGLICEGFYSVTLQPMAQRASAMVTTTGTLFVAFLVISVPIALRGSLPVPRGTDAVLSVAYLAFICTVVGYTVWVRAMRHVPVGVMFFTIFIQPIVGPFIAAIALGEALDARVIAGGLLLISGMTIAVAGHARSHRHIATAEQAVGIVGTM